MCLSMDPAHPPDPLPRSNRCATLGKKIFGPLFRFSPSLAVFGRYLPMLILFLPQLPGTGADTLYERYSRRDSGLEGRGKEGWGEGD